MFIHNLTVAFRNLTKYKTQSIVSILGLAAGFACFSLTAMWIRYENSFDDFHPKGDRIYQIVFKDKTSESGYYVGAPTPLAAYLKTNLPEVEETAMILNSGSFISSISQGKGFRLTVVDSGFIKIFDLPKVLLQELKSSQPHIIPCAVSQSVADKLLCDTVQNIIGMHSENYYRKDKLFEIQRILPDWERSEIKYDGLALDEEKRADIWYDCYYTLYVLLKEGVDKDAFIQKINDLKVEDLKYSVRQDLTAIPLLDLHKVIPGNRMASKTKYQHILIFACAGALVILCALFNYLVLFITRLKMRGRELALRKVNGATNSSLMITLLIEFGLVLLISLLAGEYLIKMSLPFFQKMSGTNMEQIDIYRETLLFAVILYIGTILLCALPIHYFRKKTLNRHLHRQFHGGIKNLFQKVVMVSQLLMSALVIIATLVIYLQVSYLQSRSMGCNLHNISSFQAGSIKNKDLSPISNAISKYPFVEKIIYADETIYPITSFNERYVSVNVEQEDGKGETEAKIREFYINPEMIDLLEIHLLEGRIFNKVESKVTIINKSASKLLGKNGKPGCLLNGHTILGIVSDFYLESPLLNIQPTMYNNMYDSISLRGKVLLYSQLIIKVKEGTNDSMMKDMRIKASQMAEELFPNWYKNWEPNWEETYVRYYLTSEKNLAKLFSIVSIICLIISIFGIYSLASLTCEQRRKEIAIRKINGATMKEILNLFFKEFFILLGIAIVIAFPIGYYVMHLWLEQYSRRVTMGPLLFLGIALALALVIILTIIFRVWRAASANPAQVIKENN